MISFLYKICVHKTCWLIFRYYLQFLIVGLAILTCLRCKLLELVLKWPVISCAIVIFILLVIVWKIIEHRSANINWDDKSIYTILIMSASSPVYNYGWMIVCNRSSVTQLLYTNTHATLQVMARWIILNFLAFINK